MLGLVMDEDCQWATDSLEALAAMNHLEHASVRRRTQTPSSRPKRLVEQLRQLQRVTVSFVVHVHHVR
jgi:L-lysine 2,3-aminomutase